MLMGLRPPLPLTRLASKIIYVLDNMMKQTSRSQANYSGDTI